jgi:tetratricopeptide (TPR) repeat protein
MKHILFILIFISLGISSKGQTVIEKIALNACECIDNATVSKADSCLTSSMAKVVVANRGSEETKFIGTVERMQQAIKDAYQMVQDNCESFRTQVINIKKANFYKDSDIKEANNYYEKGNQKLENRDFKAAIKEYKKALKIDPNFIFALDNIAVCYRNMESFDKALEYYKKSLAIFPESNFALQNIAVIYGFKGDSKSVIEYYNTLINLYPNDPEGYFGLSKVSLINGDLELATETALIAYAIYNNKKSVHLTDGEKLLRLIYSKLKESGQTDLFHQKAKELNILFEMN